MRVVAHCASLHLNYFLPAQREERQDETVDDDEETTAAHFTRRSLKHFLKGFEARDKNVRYRVVCFVAEVISQLGELEYAAFLLYPVYYKRSSSGENMYNSLRAALLGRIRDKEPPVRVQAVAALAKICGSEDLEELGEGEQTATEVLEDLLAHDPSACRPPPLPPLLFRMNFSVMYAVPHCSTHSYHGSNTSYCAHSDARCRYDSAQARLWQRPPRACRPPR